MIVTLFISNLYFFSRKVSHELKKDKECVSRAVSRCDGPGRSRLLRRFDNRITKLYGQFYRHCRPDSRKLYISSSI